MFRSARKYFIVLSTFAVLNALFFFISTDVGSGVYFLLNDREKTVAINQSSESFKSKFLHLKPICAVPRIAPFASDVLPFYKKVDRDACQIKKYGRISKGNLLLNVKNVEEAKFAYIERQDDFNNKNYKWIELLQSDLDKGHEACLQLYESSSQVLFLYASLGEFKSNNDNKEEALLSVTELQGEEAECTKDRKFKLKNEHLIHHATGKCLKAKANAEDERIYLSNEACTSVDKFSVSNERMIRHSESGLCLGYRSHDGRIRLTKCNQATQIVGMGGPSKDLDLTHPLKAGFIILTMRINGASHQEYHVNMPTQDAPVFFGLPNIVMVMLDSVSNANAERSLLKTYKRLKDDPNTMTMKGQTIVGDGTTAQLCAMLTGIAEKDLPESRRSFPKADFVDKYPFIFKELKKKGYVTLFSEDSPVLGTFNYRLKGFHKPPTDYYFRPFWIAMDKYTSNNKVSCNHEIAFDFLKTFTNAHPSSPKFSLAIFSGLAHNSMNTASLADEDLSHFLDFIENQANTFLILFGDHGPRMGDFRSTLQGKLEERLPWMSITVPASFSRDHPRLMHNLRENAEMLTSHFDMHETLRHISSLSKYKSLSQTGQSLFTEISPNRTCSQAGVEAHWCPCLTFESVSTDEARVKMLANKVVKYINELLGKHSDSREHCMKLSVDVIERASRRSPNKKMQQFKDTKRDKDCDSCGVVLDNSLKYYIYEVVFTAQPSGGRFEASVTVTEKEGQIEVSVSKDISRLNKYGAQPDCIARRLPHLRKYCYCDSFKQQ